MDDYGWNNDENNEEIEVKIIKYNKQIKNEYNTKDGVIFLIDCRSNMFEKNNDGIVLFFNYFNYFYIAIFYCFFTSIIRSYDS